MQRRGRRPAPADQMQNVLFITVDQFRGDCLSVAGHPTVRTPALDELAASGVRFARHFSQAAPCSPGRACLYTGTYQMNNRVVGNGTPLDRRFDNVALVGRRAGYAPVLFGYVDQAIDPRSADGPSDPRLSNYQGFSRARRRARARGRAGGMAGMARRPRVRRVPTTATTPSPPRPSAPSSTASPPS